MRSSFVFAMAVIFVMVAWLSPAKAQPVVPLPMVTMTPSYYTQMAIFCEGGELRMWVYEKGKGLVYCEEPTPVPTRPTSTPVPTRPTSTSTPYTVNLPIVAKGN